MKYSSVPLRTRFLSLTCLLGLCITVLGQTTEQPNVQRYAIPVDHPGAQGALSNLIGSGVQIGQLAIQLAHFHRIQVDDTLVLVPELVRDPPQEQLRACAEKFRCVLKFIQSLTHEQRDELKGGKVLPLHRLSENQLSLLEQSFKVRYGTRRPFIKSVRQIAKRKNAIAAFRILTWPGIRIIVDGVEYPCLNFMWPLWRAEFYDRFHYITIDEQTGALTAWGLENLLPPSMRGYDFLEKFEMKTHQSQLSERHLAWSLGERCLSLDKQLYSIGDLARLIRDNCGVDFYVDRRIATLRIMLSKGDYPVETLLKICIKSYGLKTRRIGKLIFLREGYVPLTKGHKAYKWDLHLVTMPLLRWAEQNVRYPGIGFPMSRYLKRERMSLSSLTPRERAFVENVWLVANEWNYAHSRCGYGYLLGRYQTAEKYYQHYARCMPDKSHALSNEGAHIEIILEPLHSLMVCVYTLSDVIARLRERDPDLKHRKDLPQMLYERTESQLLPLWPIEYSVP